MEKVAVTKADASIKQIETAIELFLHKQEEDEET